MRRRRRLTRDQKLAGTAITVNRPAALPVGAAASARYDASG